MKVIYSTVTQQVKPYPRLDDQPIEGLSPELVVLEKVEEPRPSFNPRTQRLISVSSVNLEKREYKISWQIENIPYWQGFMDACDVPERGGNGLLALALQINFQVTSTIVERIDHIVRLGTHTQYDLFWLNYLFSQIVPQMPAEKRDILNNTLQQYNIPITGKTL